MDGINISTVLYVFYVLFILCMYIDLNDSVITSITATRADAYVMLIKMFSLHNNPPLE